MGCFAPYFERPMRCLSYIPFYTTRHGLRKRISSIHVHFCDRTFCISFGTLYAASASCAQRRAGTHFSIDKGSGQCFNACHVATL
jgi:hypothetical protein